jgi:hypothetical protein
VLGCHIELARDGQEYVTGTRWQPDEAPLPLTVEDLHRIGDGVRAAAARPGVHDLGKARLWNGPCRGPALRQAGQLLWRRARGVA